MTPTPRAARPRPPAGRALAAALAAGALAACSIVPKPGLPAEPPPLADMEEPLELQDPPRDEQQRAALAPGSFTGVELAEARRSLDALEEEPAGLEVARVVENSPAAAAGVVEGDLLLEAAGRPLRWPSEWRAIEVEAAPGSAVEVLFDRAGVERRATIVVEPRYAPAARGEGERLREERHAGVVLRTATEVEAREAGLGPGGGAVIVGLARSSPWRRAGLGYGDLVVRADGEPVAHPQVVLDAIRRRAREGSLALVVRRGGGEVALEAPLGEREREVREVSVPLLYSYENARGRRTTSVLLGLFRLERTEAAWQARVLWLIRFGAGDADRLEEVRS